MFSEMDRRTVAINCSLLAMREEVKLPGSCSDDSVFEMKDQMNFICGLCKWAGAYEGSHRCGRRSGKRVDFAFIDAQLTQICNRFVNKPGSCVDVLFLVDDYKQINYDNLDCCAVLSLCERLVCWHRGRLYVTESVNGDNNQSYWIRRLRVEVIDRCKSLLDYQRKFEVVWRGYIRLKNVNESELFFPQFTLALEKQDSNHSCLSNFIDTVKGKVSNFLDLIGIWPTRLIPGYLVSDATFKMSVPNLKDKDDLLTSLIPGKAYIFELRYEGRQKKASKGLSTEMPDWESDWLWNAKRKLSSAEYLVQREKERFTKFIRLLVAPQKDCVDSEIDCHVLFDATMFRAKCFAERLLHRRTPVNVENSEVPEDISFDDIPHLGSGHHFMSAHDCLMQNLIADRDFADAISREKCQEAFTLSAHMLGKEYRTNKENLNPLPSVEAGQLSFTAEQMYQNSSERLSLLSSAPVIKAQRESTTSITEELETATLTEGVSKQEIHKILRVVSAESVNLDNWTKIEEHTKLDRYAVNETDLLSSLWDQQSRSNSPSVSEYSSHFVSSQPSRAGSVDFSSQLDVEQSESDCTSSVRSFGWTNNAGKRTMSGDWAKSESRCSSRSSSNQSETKVSRKRLRTSDTMKMADDANLSLLTSPKKPPRLVHSNSVPNADWDVRRSPRRRPNQSQLTKFTPRTQIRLKAITNSALIEKKLESLGVKRGNEIFSKCFEKLEKLCAVLLDDSHTGPLSGAKLTMAQNIIDLNAKQVILSLKKATGR